MRATPHNLRDTKYQNPDGTLKDGYTYHPVNEGYEKVGAVKTQKRTGGGRDGTNWQITGEKAIYKDGSSPKSKTEVVYVDRPAPEAEVPPAPVQLSGQAASANAATQAYEKFLLNKQGDANIRGNSSPVQDYKNAYQNNLTEELKAKAPTTLAHKRAEIELADKQKADIETNYSLNLGQY